MEFQNPISYGELIVVPLYDIGIQNLISYRELIGSDSIRSDRYGGLVDGSVGSD